MSRFVIVCLVVLISIMAASLSAQSDQEQVGIAYFGYKFYEFDFVGAGARAQGMGKAHLGLANDVNGAGWNPAGIFQIEEPVISFSMSELVPRGKTFTSVIIDSATSDHRGNFSALTALNLAAPVRIKGHPFVLSGGLNRNFNVYEQFDWGLDTEAPFFFSTPLGIIEDTLPLIQNGQTNFEGGLETWNFAFGTRFYNNISAGVSINVYSGRAVTELKQFTQIEDWLFNAVDRAVLSTDVTVIDTNKFSGINFTVGFKYNGDKTSAGLVVRTPFELKVDTDSTTISLVMINDLIQVNGTDTIYSDNNLTKYEVPLIIGLGLSRQLNENTTLAFDAEYRGFSGKKILVRESISINPGGSNIENFVEIDPEWNNVFTFRLGGEYMKESKFGMIPLRAGFGYVPIPAPNLDAGSSTTSTAVRYNFSIGSGIHWEQIHFDAAYTYSVLDRSVELFDGILENRDHHFNISFTGVF